MLGEHYAFAIDELRRFGPRPFNEEWAAALEAHEPAEAQEALLVAA
jgi:hypothetical protein